MERSVGGTDCATITERHGRGRVDAAIRPDKGDRANGGGGVGERDTRVEALVAREGHVLAVHRDLREALGIEPHVRGGGGVVAFRERTERCAERQRGRRHAVCQRWVVLVNEDWQCAADRRRTRGMRGVAEAHDEHVAVEEVVGRARWRAC